MNTNKNPFWKFLSVCVGISPSFLFSYTNAQEQPNYMPPIITQRDIDSHLEFLVIDGDEEFQQFHTFYDDYLERLKELERGWEDEEKEINQISLGIQKSPDGRLPSLLEKSLELNKRLANVKDDDEEERERILSTREEVHEQMRALASERYFLELALSVEKTRGWYDLQKSYFDNLDRTFPEDGEGIQDLRNLYHRRVLISDKRNCGRQPYPWPDYFGSDLDVILFMDENFPALTNLPHVKFLLSEYEKNMEDLFHDYYAGLSIEKWMDLNKKFRETTYDDMKILLHLLPFQNLRFLHKACLSLYVNF